MSLSPVANRSFLHGDRKGFTSSEKIVYATLDSLALKRARLPLQLLPTDTNDFKKEENVSVVSSVTGKCDRKINRDNVPFENRGHYSTGTTTTHEPPSEDHRTVESRTEYVVGRDVQGKTSEQRIDADNAADKSTIRVVENVEEREFCSGDYEKIELSSSVKKTSLNRRGVETETTSFENETALYSNTGITLKSVSLNDLGDETNTLEAFPVADKSTTTSTGLDHERESNDKKKRHFARNVLHLVPDYLAKGSKRARKKKNSLSSSWSSLRPESMDSRNGTGLDSRYRSKSLSRDESKCREISSPTNFVHVASATNPRLISNVNTVQFGSEQVVITHEEKCATVPLLVSSRDEDTSTENRSEQRSIVAEGTSDRGTSKLGRNIAISETVESRREFLLELRARSAQVLERSQRVKTGECRTDDRQERIYEPPCEPGFPLARANHSFLWSVRAKSRLENCREEEEEEEEEPWSRDRLDRSIEDDIDDGQYDDVGPSDTINQWEELVKAKKEEEGLEEEKEDGEDKYEDVGSPWTQTQIDHRIATDFDEIIYDDVASPIAKVTPNDSSSNRFKLNEPVEKNTAGSTEIQDDESKRDNDDDDDRHYPLLPNDYSSVDDADTDEMEDNEHGVYDDVGLPSEERVNSLYAGSTTGSIFGKESEWEDLEDPTTGSLSRATKDNGFSAETQVVSNKTKTRQKWLRRRKVGRQRSEVSKKSWKSTKKLIGDSTCHVAVSLGSGSILLVGRAEKIEGWPVEESNDRRRLTALGNTRRTQGLVQMRVIDLDEDEDTQETSCYVYEDNGSDDSTYESIRSFQPDDFASDFESEFESESGSVSVSVSEWETETIDTRVPRAEPNGEDARITNACLEAPTKPNPPPPREASLTQTLGRRIKMLRRTWSITKGSLGRMRRRTSVDDERSIEEANKESSNSQHPHLDGANAKYFSFARHFKKSVTGLSTFYLNGALANGSNEPTRTEDDHPTKEPVYGNTYREPENDPYSILADQEPLYQFYAAAAVRGAIDSNSEGYEEVDDTIPSQSTTDLAKPGHRTLWCQTPQVAGSHLLQHLTAEERKIQEVKFEILTSEASYLNSLRVLENEFLNEPAINDTLTSTEKDKLFGGIPSVLQRSEQFLAELEGVWRQDPMLHELPDVLLKYADKCLDIYVAYCTNQVGIDSTLKDLRTQKGQKFRETVSQIEARPTCQSLSLHSFLMLPMQRITRLPLLADAVLSKLSIDHADRSRWERVLSSLSYIVAECNEGARAAAKEVEMENLARKLEYSAKIKPILLRGKHLVKSGPVVQLLTKADAEYKLTFGKKFNKTPLYLLLLTDYLLVAKYKSSTQDDTYTVIDICKRSLIALESVPEDSPFAGRNAMLLTLLENYSGRQAEYILTCESDTERQRWLEAVSPSKHGLVGETLYEVWDCPQVVALYSYSPIQSDELSLHPGDVINVLKKMSDGWFHGEKLLDGEQGWFPGNYTKEVASEHVRARNLKQRHRLLALNGTVLQRKAKQQSPVY